MLIYASTNLQLTEVIGRTNINLELFWFFKF